MGHPGKAPPPERDQTDESLRVEREKADRALSDDLASIEDAADAVIDRARTRADRVLATARAKSDRDLANPPLHPDSPAIIARERRTEDRVVQEERAVADETAQDERIERESILSQERRETDRDLLVERERSDDALATRDEFLGIVSHDLKNMLNAIMGSAALIAADVAAADHVAQAQRHAQRIVRSAGRMNRLIGDLVDVASIEAGALTVTREIADPAEVVAEAVDTFQPLASASGISLTAEIAGPFPPMAFDAARVLQVLTNLLSNAVKFTPPQGRVVVRLEARPSHVRFAVSDTGPGIPADKLEAVFARFLQLGTNDRRGVGLGLYISRAIVQGHGGRIWAERGPGPGPGHGSTVIFTLPVQAPAGA
jgi:signal transduction histidine kinase